MRRALISTALVVALSGSLAACGGDDPASAADDAAPADFCAALADIATAYGEVAPENVTEDQVRAVKAAVSDLVEVGTPEDMTDDQRAGFELVTGMVSDLSDNATLEQLEAAGEDFSGAEEEKADAFDDYVDQTCDDMSGDDE